MINATTMCELAGCTYRQLDYWVRGRVIVPAIEARGSGSGRRFSERQVRNVRLITDLARLGAQHDVLMRASMAADLIPEPNWVGTAFVTMEGEVLLAAPAEPAWAIDLSRCAHSGFETRQLSLA